MRKQCAILAAAALLAVPAFAQKNESTSGYKKTGAETADRRKELSALAADFALGTKSIWALPAEPRPNPFPFPAGSPDDDSPGKLLPRYEIAGLYQYIDFSPGGPFANFNNHGGTGSFTYNASRFLGLTAEVGGYHFRRDVNGNPVSGGLTSYLFGPRMNLRKFDHFVPFGEVLIGGIHGGSQVTGDQGQSSFALAAGGGLDIVLSRYFAWRFAQIDYLMTNFSGPSLNPSARQNDFRAGTGVVFRWGIPQPPPPPNHPPVASCTADPTSVYAGSNASAAIHVNANDPDNDQLTYTYTATGGTVEGTGPEARWNSSGLAAGSYTVNAKVDDGKGGTASCSADVQVQQKPNQPPTISCSTDRSPIMPGERTGISAAGNDPDGDTLTYNYTTTGGQIVGTGAKVEFDSTGLQPGSYTVKCSVNDSKGGTADASTNVDVQQPPPPPQPVKVGDCGYSAAGASRFDNACKRVGDDVALRLQNEPAARLVIVGYADSKEPRASRLAATRADLAKKYIVEKGIDESRIATRIGEASPEKGQEKENRRVDFVIVPEGATY